MRKYVNAEMQKCRNAEMQKCRNAEMQKSCIIFLIIREYNIMKTTNKVLLTTIAVSLIACGGGGSSSSKGSSISTTKTPITKKPTTATPITKKPTTATPITKKPTPTKNPVLTAPIKKPIATTKPKELSLDLIATNDPMLGYYQQNDDINILFTSNPKGGIKGQKITLIPKGFNTDGFFKIDNGIKEQRIISGKNYSLSKFGIIQVPIGGFLTTLIGFSRGYVTKDIPNSGKLIYKGDYVSASTVLPEDFKTVGNGKITFNVDFGNKTITGDIPANNHISFKSDLKGKIHGSSFNTSVGTLGFNYFKGAFYGSKAEELGGVYNNPSIDVIASFGAKKQ